MSTIGGGSLRAYGRFGGSDPGLYPFTTQTFVTCGGADMNGPTLSQILSTYSNSPVAGYVTMGTYQGYQVWTVPKTGVYDITVAGASPRAQTYQSPFAPGGPGAVVRASAQLVEGSELIIIVGQMGMTRSSNFEGGAGGSFVVSGSSPLICAGGGASTRCGGASSANVQSSASYPSGTGQSNGVTTSWGLGGTNGNGGTDYNSPNSRDGTSGSGFYSAGGQTYSGLAAGYFANGFEGGVFNYSTVDKWAHGGFGGGAGGGYGGSGGGGGYNGGGSGANSNTWGGGGGSYIDPSMTFISGANSLSTAVDGYVTISLN